MNESLPPPFLQHFSLREARVQLYWMEEQVERTGIVSTIVRHVHVTGSAACIKPCIKPCSTGRAKVLSIRGEKETKLSTNIAVTIRKDRAAVTNYGAPYSLPDGAHFNHTLSLARNKMQVCCCLHNLCVHNCMKERGAVKNLKNYIIFKKNIYFTRDE